MITLKDALRRQYKSLRRQIPPPLRAQKSQAAVRLLLQSPLWHQSQQLLAYLALSDELSLDSLFTLASDPLKTLHIPISMVQTRRLLISRLDDFAQLTPGAYGIRELTPQYWRLIAPETLDLALIPGIAFDRLGNRVGFGAGYYDRFLPQLRPDAVKIGVCFAEQLSPAPFILDAHDITMDYILTDTELYKVSH